jgi:hypothetical protein
MTEEDEETPLGSEPAHVQGVVGDPRFGSQPHQRQAVDPRPQDQLRLLGGERAGRNRLPN